MVAAAGAALLGVLTLPPAPPARAFHHVDLRIGLAFRLTLSSYFFNQLLPSNVGGDIYRTVRLRNGSGGWVSTIGLIVLERTIGSLALILPALGYAVAQHGGDRVIRELRGHLGSRSATAAVIAGLRSLRRCRVPARAPRLACCTSSSRRCGNCRWEESPRSSSCPPLHALRSVLGIRALSRPLGIRLHFETCSSCLR
jgi:hypothetical protein